MRIVVLAPNIYSERALGLMVALADQGHAPVGCLCVKTFSVRDVVRKLVQYGPRRFIGYALRRTGLAPSSGTKPGQFAGFENPYLADRVQRSPLRSSNVVEVCRRLEIPLKRCAHFHQSAALNFLRGLEPDVLVYAGGGILRTALIQIPRLGVLNAHAGELPEYRGMNVAEWSILKGDVPALTLHLIDPGVDTGPILSVRRIEWTDDDTSVGDVRKRIANLTVDLLVEGVSMLAEGCPPGAEQQRNEGRQYYVMHEKLLELVDRRLQMKASKGTTCPGAV